MADSSDEEDFDGLDQLQIASVGPLSQLDPHGAVEKKKPSRKKMQMGTRIADCELVSSYSCTVPLLLVQLWKAMQTAGSGVATEGLFRVTPDSSDLQAVEKALASGKSVSLVSQPPEVLAYLIKSFFRKLPAPGLLGSIPVPLLIGCTDAPGCAALMDELPTHERALLDWLIRVVLEVNEKRDINKMGLKNLTVVFAPNLRQVPLTPGMNPLEFAREELENVQRVESALNTLCRYALKLAGRYSRPTMVARASSSAM
jgi:hypothetical protein